MPESRKFHRHCSMHGTSSSTFPIRGGVMLKEVASVKAVDDVTLAIQPGRDPGAGGRVGVRQDHLRPGRPASGGAHLRGDSISRAGICWPARPSKCGTCANGCRSSFRTPFPPSTRERPWPISSASRCWSTACAAARSATPGFWSCFGWWGFERSTCAATPTSSPGGSVSASAWPGPWP